jgi:hemoglobin
MCEARGVARSSIYDAAGGMPAFLMLAAAHHRRCLDDPILNHPFSHPGHRDHVARLALYWAEVMGGPAEFTRCCGDHASLLHLHAHTDAEEDLGRRFLACFVAALDDAELPDDRELRHELCNYMRWAVGDVMSHAPKDAVVPRARAVPRWSWDGIVPAAH